MNNQFFLNYFGLSSLLSTVPHSLIFLFQVWLLEPLWLHFIRRNNSAQYVSQCQLWARCLASHCHDCSQLATNF